MCLVLLGVVQLAVIVRDQLAVGLAAREAARAAAVAAEPGATAVDLPGIELRISHSADTVTVTASYVDPTDVPLIGLLLPDVRVEATASMHLEPP